MQRIWLQALQRFFPIVLSQAGVLPLFTQEDGGPTEPSDTIVVRCPEWDFPPCTFLKKKALGFVAVPLSEILFCTCHEVKLSGRVHRNPYIPILCVNGPSLSKHWGGWGESLLGPSVWWSTYTAPFRGLVFPTHSWGVSFQRQTDGFLFKAASGPTSTTHQLFFKREAWPGPCLLRAPTDSSQWCQIKGRKGNKIKAAKRSIKVRGWQPICSTSNSLHFVNKGQSAIGNQMLMFLWAFKLL